MVVKDTRNVRTGTNKSQPEWAPLRRMSSLEKTKLDRKNPSEKMAATIIEGLKEIDGEIEKVVVGISNPPTTQKPTQTRTPPHYQLPTLNSSHQARVQSKTSTPPDFVKVRRFSLGLDKSPSVCKYDSKDSRRSSLGAKSSGLRSGLKPYRAIDKTPVNTTTRLKSVGEKTQVLKSPSSGDKTPIARRPLQSVTLKASRATCSSSCKHFVKGGDLTISPDPRCPYVYCSLNHLHRESPPPLKQFLASRRRLLRTQKSFKWVGLTPVPKGSVDRGDGVETSSLVDTGQNLYVVGHEKDDAGENGVLIEIGKMDGGLSPSLKDSQIVDCDDYDDGHSTGDALVSELDDNQIEIVESLVDELNARAMDEEPLEPFGAEDDDIEDGAHELGFEASPGDVDESVEEFAEDEDLKTVNHELEVEAPPDVDVSIEEFVKDEDIKHDNYEIELEPTYENGSIKIAGILVDESAVEARLDESAVEARFDESTELPADNELTARAMDKEPLESFGEEDDDIRYGAHELGVEASPGDVDEFVEEFAKDENLTNVNHELEVEAPSDVDVSIDDFVKDNDVKHDNYEIELEPTDENGRIKIAGILLDESAVEARSDESTDLPADSEDVRDGKLEFDLEASANNFYDYGQIENTQGPCFIQEYTLGAECSLIAEHDGLPHASFPVDNDDFSESQDGEALSEVDGGNCKDQFEGCVEDCDQIGENRERCFIQLHVPGFENSGHTEPDSPQVEASSKVNSGVKDGVPEGCDSVSESSEGGSVSEASVTDDAEQPAGYSNGQFEDTEHCCFIQVNYFGNECDGHTGSDGLAIEVEEEHDTTSGSSECESISQVDASNHIEHVSGSVSDHDQFEDSGQRRFIWLNAQVTECNSHAEPNELPYAPLPDINSCIKDEIKGDYGCVSGNSEDGSAYEIGINNISEHDNDISNELDSYSTRSGETKCYIQVDTYGMQRNSQIEFDSPPNKSVVDANANSSSKQESKEEYIPITGYLCDGFDDDYNLTSLFSECNDEISWDIKSHWPVQFDSSGKQFSITSNFDDELDKPLSEFNVNTKFEEEESRNLTSGDDDECVSEIYDYDVVKHYLECELLKNEILRTSNDYDDGHANDTNLSQPLQVETAGAHCTTQLEPGSWDDRFLVDIDLASNSDAREEYPDISEISLNESGTECKQTKKELKKHRSISEKNENKPYHLKFRRGRVHPFLDQLSEAEKVALRHQIIEERRASHEWMMDYALTKIVKKLSPFRKRKVELLVEAFETVIPLSKCETDLPHATTDSTYRTPIKACN